MRTKVANLPPQPRRGFSLLELLAVVTIFGILAVVLVPRVSIHGHKAKVEACKQYKGDLNAALERYYFAEGTFATNVSVLEQTDYYPEDIPNCPVDDSAYTIDSSSHRIEGHNH